MANIQYSEHIDDVLDRLRNLVNRQRITEEDYIMLSAPKRLQKATSEAMLRLCRVVDPAAIPDLFNEKSPTADRTKNKVSAYPFPQEMFYEREDKGVLKILLNDEAMNWNEAIDRQEVEFYASSELYGPDTHVFAADEIHRTFYAPEDVTFAIKIFEKPDPVDDNTTELPIPRDYDDELAEQTMGQLIDILSPASGGEVQDVIEAQQEAEEEEQESQ